MSRLTVGQPGKRLSRADLHQVQTETFIERVELHEQICSTNDRALMLAGAREERYPLLVVTNTQTDGRGRGTNRWWASEGSLAFSLLLQTEQAGLPRAQWPQVSLTVGLAVCEAIEDLIGDHEVRLKWPNDVFVQGRKVCGVLVEIPPDVPQMLVLGVGVNVNNSVENAPADLIGSAIALSDAAGRWLPLATVLTRVLDRLSHLLSWIGSRDEELLRRWRQRCLLTRRHIQMDLSTHRLTGVCQGIDDQGALLVQTMAGIERCFGGVVTHF